MSKHKRNKPPQNNQLAQKPATIPQPNGMVASFSRQEIFTGPLPRPEILAKYNDAVPDGAERIIRMAEKQQEHRMYLEKTVIDGDSRRANRGQFLGFILGVLVIVGGVILLALEKEITGLALIFVPLATLVGVFIKTSKSRAKEREAKGATRSERKK